jgi:hypothetical protein
VEADKTLGQKATITKKTNGWKIVIFGNISSALNNY